MYEFNSNSNRMLQVDFHDYLDVLTKYVHYLENTEIIYDYIKSCGNSTFDVATEYKVVSESFGSERFELGANEKEEIANIFAILKYAVDNQIPINRQVGRSYSNSSQYQDWANGFNQRVVNVLIQKIEKYLTMIGIEMGLDDKNTYNISAKNGQVIFVNDSSNVTATNNAIQPDQLKVKELLDKLEKSTKKLDNINPEELDQINTSMEMLKEELAKPTMKPKHIVTLLKPLTTI